MKLRLAFALLALSAIAANAQESARKPHNVIIFVADGLRYGSVEPGNLPNLARIKREGVDFTNSHSLYPTVTTVNASAIATGHYIGDTGNFGNTLFTGSAMDSAKGSVIPFLEVDAVLDEMNRKFGGNYLNETSLMAHARSHGWQTAVIGKEGPVRIQDLTSASNGNQTLFLDDSTGREGGIGLPAWFSGAMKSAFMDKEAPKNGVPNIEQEVWQTKAATRIVLPHFQETGKPFMLTFWSRDPDVSQHNTRDSLGETKPGINGPSAKAGTRNADTVLGELLDTLKRLGLDKTTDVFVTADHGFATVDHNSDGRELASNFLPRDLAQALSLPGTGNILGNPAEPELIVAGNAGSDLIYLPASNAAQLAPRIVSFLLTQPYVGAIFVNDKFGKIPGTLAMSDVGLIGSAQTPQPAIYVSFRTKALDCANPLQCTTIAADTPLATGQGVHGSLSRAETRNFMAAIGPSFKRGYADPTPISNADIAPTLARIMGLELPAKGALKGRVISEALVGGKPVSFTRRTIASEPGPGGMRTLLNQQNVGITRYFDAAGFVGRVVGLKEQ